MKMISNALKNVLIINLFLIFSNSYSITIDSFLMTVQKDYDLEAQNEINSNIAELQSSIPLINDVEFDFKDIAPFSKTIDFQNRMRYSLRITPDGIGKRIAQKEYNRICFDRGSHKKQVILNDLLKERYYMVIDFMYKSNQLKRLNQLSTLYQDRVMVLEKKINEADFDFEKLISAEDAFTQIQMTLIEKKNEIGVLERDIKMYLPDSAALNFDTASLISIDSLYITLCKTPVIIDSCNIHLEQCVLDLNEAKSRYNLERASARRYRSFLEVEYAQDKFHEESQLKDENDKRLLSGQKIKKNYDFSKAFSVELGITFPMANLNRNDLIKRKINLTKARADHNELKENLERAFSSLKGEIQTLIEQYSFVMKRENEIRTENSLAKYKQIEGEDPLKLLEIQESILKSEQMMDKLRHNVYQKYIKMMDITGQLSCNPIRNYLSKNQDLLE